MWTRFSALVSVAKVIYKPGIRSDGDFRTAQRELAAAEAPNLDAVCLHAQQCVEKLI